MGIEVKPSKSYMYTNIPGPPVYVTTYPQADTKYKLTTPTHTNLREIGASDYTRYLGNIQNAAGHSPLETIKMHDDSTYENIQTKIKKPHSNAKAQEYYSGGASTSAQGSITQTNTLPYNVCKCRRAGPEPHSKLTSVSAPTETSTTEPHTFRLYTCT